MDVMRMRAAKAHRPSVAGQVNRAVDFFHALVLYDTYKLVQKHIHDCPAPG